MSPPPRRWQRTLSSLARAGLTTGILLTVAGCWTSSDNAGIPPEATAEPSYDELYVSPDGQDDWAGTETRPWRTLGHALEQLTAGQLLYVRGGVYREQLVQLNIKDGLPARRIVVKAYPGERPVVRGLLRLREPSYWTVDGLDVTWDQNLPPSRTPQHMVKLTGGEGWIWTNSEIWGARAGANVLISGRLDGEPADWLFTENCVHDVMPPSQGRRGSNIAVGTMIDAGPGSITHNVVFGVGAGRNIALGLDSTGSGGPTDVTVAYNTLYGANVAVSLAGRTSGVDIERNLFGGTSSGALVRSSQLSGPDNVVRENAGVDAGRFFFEQWGSLRRGNGNVLAQAAFDDVSTCDGLRSSEGVALSYGRDGEL
jgi:hypothetical protein